MIMRNKIIQESITDHFNLKRSRWQKLLHACLHPEVQMCMPPPNASRSHIRTYIEHFPYYDKKQSLCNVNAQTYKGQKGIIM